MWKYPDHCSYCDSESWKCCNAGYFLSSTNGKCISCPDHCYYCNEQGLCRECEEWFTIDENFRCIKWPEKCSYCKNSKICYQCNEKTGFRIVIVIKINVKNEKKNYCYDDQSQSIIKMQCTMQCWELPKMCLERF